MHALLSHLLIGYQAGCRIIYVFWFVLAMILWYSTAMLIVIGSKRWHLIGMGLIVSGMTVAFIFSHPVLGCSLSLSALAWIFVSTRMDDFPTWRFTNAIAFLIGKQCDYFYSNFDCPGETCERAAWHRPYHHWLSSNTYTKPFTPWWRRLPRWR